MNAASPLSSRPIDRVLDQLDRVQQSGGGFTARCPAHDDRKNSLSVGEGDDGRVLIRCHAGVGCPPEQIVASLRLTIRDLFPDDGQPPRPAAAPAARRIVATYDYHAADGCQRFQVVRYEPKSFRQRQPDGNGGWIWNLRGIEDPPLYHPPELIAEPNRWVALCAGEKDADRVRSLGLLATTVPMGEGKPWRHSHSESLRGRKVVILADNDTVGDGHAHNVAQALQGVAEEVKVVTFPGLPVKGDVSDWLDLGHDKADLIRLMKDTPIWSPQAVSDMARGAEQVATLVVTSLADVQPEPVEWVWDQRIPKGKLSLFGGHPGIGKSTVLSAIAAKLSTGGRWPDGAPVASGNTLFLLAEDGLADTLRPRLDVHGADVSRIFAIQAVREPDGTQRLFHIERHLDLLRAEIITRSIALLVIDPLTAFMAKADRNSEGDVRDTLTPLA
jgi:putative DNA primase/helicase